MMYKLIYVLLILVFNLVNNSSAFVCEKTTNSITKELSNEERLRDDLLCGYQKYFLPLENRSEEMDVKIDMNIEKYYISESSPESLHIDTIITVTWNDFHLKWSPNNYNSINEIIIETDDIWRPLIAPQELEIFATKPSILDSSECKVTYEGNVSCKATSLHYGYCKSEVFKWPYEIHKCDIQYVLMTHNGEMIITDIDENKTIHINEENEDWKIIQIRIENWRSKPEQNIFFTEMHFFFEVQQTMNNPIQLFYTTLFTLVSLTLLSFWIFFDDTSRLVLILMNILCHFYELENFKWHMIDVGHTIPCILAFYRDSLILTFVQLVETVALKKIFESEKPTPYLITLLNNFANNNTIKQVLLIQDNMIMDEEKEIDENNLEFVRKYEKNKLRQVMFFLDRVFLLCVVFGYIILVITLTSFMNDLGRMEE